VLVLEGRTPMAQMKAGEHVGWAWRLDLMSGTTPKDEPSRGKKRRYADPPGRIDTEGHVGFILLVSRKQRKKGQRLLPHA